MVKLELLDSKRVSHITEQLTRLMAGLAHYHRCLRESFFALAFCSFVIMNNYYENVLRICDENTALLTTNH